MVAQPPWRKRLPLYRGLCFPIYTSLFLCLIIVCSACQSTSSAVKPTQHPPTSTPIPASAAPSPLSQDLLTSFQMITTTTGWATTQHSVWRTTDGGSSWHDLWSGHLPASPSTIPATVTGSYYLTAATAWIAAVSDQQPATLSLYQTSDGGQSWQTYLFPGDRVSQSAALKLSFINDHTGWAMEYRGASTQNVWINVYRTSDGGKSWQEVVDMRYPPLPNLGAAGLPQLGGKSGLSFVDASTGWVTGYTPAPPPMFYITHNGGQSWQPQSLPLPTALQVGDTLEIDPPLFFNATDGILPTSYADPANRVNGRLLTQFLVTHDSGASWKNTTSVPTSTYQGQVADFSFSDLQHGWVIVDGMHLATTSDGGGHWTIIQPQSIQSGPLSFQHLDFVSSTTGWALSSAKAGSMLYKTQDGGQSWAPLATFPDYQPFGHY